MNQHAPESSVQCSCLQKSRLNDARKAGRSRFQEWLGEHLKAQHRRGNTLAESWSSVWGVSRQQVQRWASVLHTGSAIAAGDLEALPPSDLLELLEAWAERVRERLAPVSPAVDASMMVVDASVIVGNLAAKVHSAICEKSRGGRTVTADEWREIADEWAVIERTARERRLAAMAAADRGAR